MWLTTKLVEKKQGTLTSYYFKSLECEICKSPYPCTVIILAIDTVLVGSKHYNLIEIVKPTEGDYIQLETISQNKSYSRAIHIVQMDSSKPQIKIGRGHDSDLRIEDISVSRVHALITKTNEGYMLHDNNSKFGTLYLLSAGPHEIPATNGLFLQFGRTTLGFTVKENSSPANRLSVNANMTVPETLSSPL